FRLFEIDRLGSRIKGALYADGGIGAVDAPWRNIGNILAVAVQDRRAVLLGLGFVPMIFSIVLTVQVILVLSPGDTRHHLNVITMLAPGFNSLRQGGIDPIGHRDIGG